MPGTIVSYNLPKFAAYLSKKRTKAERSFTTFWMIQAMNFELRDVIRLASSLFQTAAEPRPINS